MGWDLGCAPSTVRNMSRTGGQQGTSTDMVLLPGKRFAISVFTNNENAKPFEVTAAILDLYHMPRPHPEKCSYGITSYSLVTMPLLYCRVPMWRSLMSFGTCPNSGMPSPINTGTRVMVR
jgi:hypothetical protein